MLPDRVSNPGPLTYESGVLPIALRGPARSRSLGLFRKSKTRIIAKFHRTDLVFCSHSRERKIPSYSRINMVSIEKESI